MGVLTRGAQLLLMMAIGGSSFALADSSDPFDTQSLVGPSPAVSPLGSGAASPCDFPPVPTTPLSLADVVERALCNNPQTREAWANARVQAAQLGVSKAANLPSLSATGRVSHNATNGRGTQTAATTFNQRSAGLSLTYLLYDFGGRSASISNARQVLIAANATQDSTIQNVFLAAVQDYYQVFSAQSVVQADREAEKAAQQSLKAATVRYQVGAGTPADKLQAQTAYSQAVLNRIRAEGDAKNAQGALADVMGLDADTAVKISPPVAQTPDENFTRDVTRLIEEARNNRPDLAAAEAQIKAAQASVTSAQAAGRPSLSLSGDLNYSDTSVSDPFRSSALGLTVTIPLFTGYDTTYRVRAAREQVAVRVAQRDNLRRQVALDVWKAYQSLITETQSLKSSADLVASAAQSERVAMGRYKAGAGNILDVLTAQSALASARQQNVQALYGWYIAKATLAQAMGQMDIAAIAAPATR
ncbi:MAG: TolC family protein [Gammaproteobacteria bacterium]|jgi:outer membrane protein